MWTIHIAILCTLLATSRNFECMNYAANYRPSWFSAAWLSIVFLIDFQSPRIIRYMTIATIIRYLDVWVLCNRDLDGLQGKNKRHEYDIYAGANGLSDFSLLCLVKNDGRDCRLNVTVVCLIIPEPLCARDSHLQTMARAALIGRSREEGKS